ncbi:MAG TPA: tetratricopeptide repeat protein [Cellvibrionaceae bacterium]|nr:tetratricopeptide repeat protein [Cellvibrionaceae bacterium]HMW71652.1 tetratricopeptide repeat protein [Cellvibrionaceae bacterium]HNG59393.1 tetratricopeptide repeat protein [Cellvibrionaceae bacterium]
MNKLIRSSHIALWLLITLLLGACAGQSQKEPSAQTKPAAALRAEDQGAWQASQQLIKQQKWPEAKNTLQNLAKTNPQFPGVLINLAAVECQLQQWQAAGEWLKRLANAQQSPQALNLLGVVAEHSGQINQAEQYYLSAVNSPSAPAEAQYNLALLYDIYWQDPLKALPYYEAYAKARPEDKAASDWINEIKRKAKR